MRLSLPAIILSMGVSLAPSACTSPEDITIRGSVDVVVVEGTITNLAETMVIQLSRSKADSLTGRPGSLPLTQATVAVIIDSSQVITCQETSKGTYQLPTDFKGQIGHAYQLRFTLSNGTHYLSTPQIMPPVPPIGQVNVKPGGGGAYDLLVTTRDPANATNFYRWEWRDYEPQTWCRSCYQGIYVENALIPILPYTYPTYYRSSTQPYEDCFYPPLGTPAHLGLINHWYDYRCRTQCWEILYSHSLNVFSDIYTNGGLIANRYVGFIPYYQASPCLIDIRQESLTQGAYQYFHLFQEQTEKTGGLADTPPTAPRGNIHNEMNQTEVVVGYFTASAIASAHYYLDRHEARGATTAGLFYSLTGRQSPRVEGPTEQNYILNTARPPTAVCGPLDQRTPTKPTGWPN